MKRLLLIFLLFISSSNYINELLDSDFSNYKLGSILKKSLQKEGQKIDLPFKTKIKLFKFYNTAIIYKIFIEQGQKLEIDLNYDIEVFIKVNDNFISINNFESKENTYYNLYIIPKFLDTRTIKLTIKKFPSLLFPVAGKNKNNILSKFGAPRGNNRKHEGVDIFAKFNTPIYSVDDSIVINTESNPLGGNSIILWDEKRQFYYYYTHLINISVKKGDIIKRGKIIGGIGNTGNALTTPPHLHFGIYKMYWYNPIDPITFISYTY